MNYLGIEENKLEKVGNKLNTLLATYSIYYQNLRSFHWHIQGNSFFDIHELFEDLYNDAKEKIDDIAERILTINNKPLGSLSEYIAYSKIPESKDEMRDDKMATDILENHKKLIEIMRETIREASEIGDEGTVDMLGGFLGTIEKKSWMLNAWKTSRKAEFMMPSAS
jgi:starvation-inducible DNA-binding protein